MCVELLLLHCRATEGLSVSGKHGQYGLIAEEAYSSGLEYVQQGDLSRVCRCAFSSTFWAPLKARPGHAALLLGGQRLSMLTGPVPHVSSVQSGSKQTWGGIGIDHPVLAEGMQAVLP